MTDLTPQAAALLALGVCSQGHAVYEYADVTPEGRCVRCVAEMADERRRVYGTPSRWWRPVTLALVQAMAATPAAQLALCWLALAAMA